MTETAKQLRNARLRLGLTQREAAEVIGRTRRCWQSWETGQRLADPSCIELFMLKTGLKSNEISLPTPSQLEKQMLKAFRD